MAFPFNNYPQYYPQGYQQYYPQQTQGQIQNGGIIPVSSIDVARNYHVAPGTSVTFIDENAPYVYTKTMGFSQLESPRFEKYRLIKEDAVIPSNPPDKDGSDGKAMNDTIDGIISEIEAIKEEIKTIKERLKSIKPIKKPIKEDEDDE